MCGWIYSPWSHCGLVMPYGYNGLVPDGTKPLPELMLPNQQWHLFEDN